MGAVRGVVDLRIRDADSRGRGAGFGGDFERERGTELGGGGGGDVCGGDRRRLTGLLRGKVFRDALDGDALVPAGAVREKTGKGAEYV